MPRNLIQLLAEETGESLFALAEDRLAVGSAEPAQRPQQQAVAIIPLQGVMTPRGISLFGRQLAPGMDAFRARLNQAAADPSVSAIVLDVDSPGGAVKGAIETAAAVKAAAAVKPVIAVGDSTIASAAYWAVAPSTSIVLTPSADVGAIGVFATHLDYSKALEADGVTPTIVRAGRFKAERHPMQPLSPEALAALQAEVDGAYEEFVKTVAQGRNTTPKAVREGFGEGRLVGAKQAVSMGMADRVGTMTDVLSGLVNKRAFAPRRGAFDF